VITAADDWITDDEAAFMNELLTIAQDGI